MGLSNRVVARHLRAQEEARALEALTDRWVDAFLDGLHVRLTERDVSSALESQGLSADRVNEALGVDTKQAGIGSVVRVLGGLLTKSVWGLITRPFLAVGKFIASSKFRSEIKVAFKRALSHEVRATQHMASVASRLARGEEVKPQEIKAATRQFVDIMAKAILLYITGPQVTGLFQQGIWKALATLMGPVDEALVILLNGPLRAAAKRFLQAPPV